ncbi:MULTISPECIES: MFS transporter [Acidiphilium]|jgi:EmrB/QacA subfamily drug resistance transporter|uniref:Major facilitator superfamily MFS_1 n=2 Tax=Acidiphilium TaxID=522 RepID=A5FW29_ACICJ|nr:MULTISPECIES: MFS transporter [Acidiphilium]MBU6356437.1 MFS transporter [Rhodospirillales bacterium]ABQ29811.1 major facilitator superfamily MFS_1 [Acidiphilium cryptum JF-5]EGO94121.1 Major facilitator transporter [Acidiphilium sp. PM]KDM65211.1 putative transport protein HsrA [Acidiphilium sp. JA12-A1]MBS3025103.1 MFS transporter [Acidiphilium multivorum]
MDTEPEDEAATLSPSQMRLTALIVATALFMQNLDGTIVATALPAMAKSFHADPLHMSLALTSYLLSLAIFIPASGWFADRFGSRTVFRAAILVFTIGSILCGLSQSLGQLIAARIFQGLGGAMMVPVGRLLLLKSVRRRDMIAATSWLTMPALLGPIIGPPLGGFIVTYLSWRWTFDINVPIGLIGIVAVTLHVREVKDAEHAGRLDIAGLVWSGLAMALLMSGFETIGRGLIPLGWSLGCFAAGAVASLAYWRHARRHPHPILDLTLMRIDTFANSTIAGSFFRVLAGAMPFLLPLMLQLGFGDSAAKSGTITFAAAVGALAMKPLAEPILRRLGFRVAMMLFGGLAVVFTAACAAFRPGWPELALDAVLLVGGVFRSLQFTALNTIAYADVPRSRMSAATSFYATFQQITLTLGISVAAGALEFTTIFAGHAEPSIADYGWAFLIVSAIGGLSVPVCARLSPAAGDDVSGHHAPPPAGPAIDANPAARQ